MQSSLSESRIRHSSNSAETRQKSLDLHLMSFGLSMYSPVCELQEQLVLEGVDLKTLGCLACRSFNLIFCSSGVDQDKHLWHGREAAAATWCNDVQCS